jgi:hypothetical protein
MVVFSRYSHDKMTSRMEPPSSKEKKTRSTLLLQETSSDNDIRQLVNQLTGKR